MFDRLVPVCIGSVCLLGLLQGCGPTAESSPAAGSTEASDASNNSAGVVDDSKPAAAAGKMKMAAQAPGDIVFQDDVETNFDVPEGLEGLVFLDTNGQRVALESYLGKQNVLLVFTEGFTGMLCPFCKTQTSRLVANNEKFLQLDTQVLVVYPGTRDHLEEFIEAARTEQASVEKVPFPILLDEEFSATDFFRIRSNFAHPSTFIIDKEGSVKLAYVGADMTADRPSIKAILKVIGSLDNP